MRKIQSAVKEVADRLHKLILLFESLGSIRLKNNNNINSARRFIS